MGRFKYDYILPVDSGKYNFILKKPQDVLFYFMVSFGVVSIYLILKYRFKHIVKDAYDMNKCDPFAMIFIGLFDEKISIKKAVQNCSGLNTDGIDDFNKQMAYAFSNLEELIKQSRDSIKDQFDNFDFNFLAKLKEWINQYATTAIFVLTQLQRVVKGTKEIIDKVAASLVVFMYTCISLMNIAIQSIKFVEQFLLVILIILVFVTFYIINGLVALAIYAYATIINFPIGIKLTAVAIVLLVFLILLLIFIVIVSESMVVTKEVNDLIQKENAEIEKFKRSQKSR